MTRLSWPGLLIKYREGANAIRTCEGTHPSTNRARCRITTLIVTNALPLHQTLMIFSRSFFHFNFIYYQVFLICIVIMKKYCTSPRNTMETGLNSSPRCFSFMDAWHNRKSGVAFDPSGNRLPFMSLRRTQCRCVPPTAVSRY